MSLYNGPPRGGSRGGRDQFNWENVKGDKDREFYLGHSVNALQGRWQKGKDVYWYTRSKADQDAAEAAEVLAVKQREEDLMAEALGIKPKTIRAPKQPLLDQRDMAQLMQRGEDKEGEDPARQAERIKGLGYKINAMTGAGEAEREVLAGTAPAPPAPGQQAQAQANGAALPPPPALSAVDAKRMRKAQKKAAKEQRRAEKKEKRRAKKAMKKAKKEAKQAKEERKAESPAHAKSAAPSSTDSSSSDEPSGDEPAANGREAAADAGLKRSRHHSPGFPQQHTIRANPEEESRQRRRHDSDSPPPRRDRGAAPARAEHAEHWRDLPERDRREPHRHAADSRDKHKRERSPDYHRRDAAARDANVSPPRYRASRDHRRADGSREPRDRRDAARDVSASPPRHRVSRDHRRAEDSRELRKRHRHDEDSPEGRRRPSRTPDRRHR